MLIDGQLEKKGMSSGGGGSGGAGGDHAASSTASSTTGVTTSTTTASSTTGVTTSTSADASSSSGGCGSVCTLANAMSDCLDGACAITACTGKFDDCDKKPENGCEVNLTSDAEHCGSCGNACISPYTCLGSKCK